MRVTFAKLKDGKWGVRCVAEDPFEELPTPGADVTVTKRDGSEQSRKLGSTVWTGTNNDGSKVGIYEVLF